MYSTPDDSCSEVTGWEHDLAKAVFRRILCIFPGLFPSQWKHLLQLCFTIACISSQSGTFDSTTLPSILFVFHLSLCVFTRSSLRWKYQMKCHTVFIPSVPPCCVASRPAPFESVTLSSFLFFSSFLAAILVSPR